jgi:hypothetical protein
MRSVELQSLKRGMSKSCGCLRAELTANAKTIHGACKNGQSTAEFTVWMSMRRRCHDLRDLAYKDYGGRGIKVCERWQSFENFFADMGRRPEGLQIDRIDNNGHYEPGNCRWTTCAVQARNRRNNRLVIFNGVTMTLKDAAMASGVKYTTAYMRITARGWSVERALLG